MRQKTPANPPKPQSGLGTPRGSRRFPLGLPADIAAIRAEIRSFFQSLDERGRRIGSLSYGVYAFYDYDGEPIYIGQTYEGLRDRIGRHLTNQRTDAVAMNVLDPFEVAEIRVWPLDLDAMSKQERRKYLDRAEFTLFQTVIAESRLGAVLNEKPPDPAPLAWISTEHNSPNTGGGMDRCCARIRNATTAVIPS